MNLFIFFRRRFIFFFFVLLVFTLAACAQEIEPPVPDPEVAAAPALAEADPLPTPEVNISEIEPDPAADPAVQPTAPAPETPAAIPTTAAGGDRFANLPGALIAIGMESEVAILLDEFPAETREEIAAALLDQDESAWLARAARQVRLTRNRLNFRNFIYSGKGQLPLPPEALWQITLDPAGPRRQEIQSHDLIVWGYSFRSTLLTDDGSPAISEPALAAAGGVWNEPFVFPADPDYLLQRTGNACVNEGGFPPNSFDAENVWHFYDFGCTADSSGPSGCHRTSLPTLSCREALVGAVGEVTTSLIFERLEWDPELAAAVRLGEITTWDGPDLAAVEEDLNTNRIVYRYFDSDDCALEEGAVGGTGWRRLLLFDATVSNVGNQPLHIGRANVQDDENHVFTYSPCHDHFHYSNYGSFFIEDQAGATGSKQAFCVQSTTRMSNHELSPLVHDYSCSFQGIQTGWADEYIAGLDAQWVDITGLEIPPEGLTVELGFASNEDKFLCEGSPVVDDRGEQIWEFSGFLAEDGHRINRPVCNFVANWETNNEATTPVIVPQTGGTLTEPCPDGEFGPLRNCGFAELVDLQTTCSPGTTVALRLPELPGEPQVVRVCERSEQLNSGLACTFESALFNAVAMAAGESISFACPAVRDGALSMGGFAVYTAPLFPAP